MSVKLVIEEIQRFLLSPDPEVLFISGEWGVGKTYTWNQYLRKAAEQGRVALKKYSYVSLFGLDSIEELKYSIFENIQSISELEKDLGTSSEKQVKSWRQFMHTVGESINQHFSISLPFEKFFFRYVSNQIVCIDDLERRGEDLTIKNVFGLISFLKEQRKCKVVLLLSEGGLDKDAQNYEKLLEKISDTELSFIPTATEAAGIVFPAPEGISKKIRDFCVTLGVTNIRVIKKIERACLRLEEIFKTEYPELLHQALHSGALFVWQKYQKDDAPPTIQFLKDIGRLHGFSEDKDKVSPNDAKWVELMLEYKFGSVDEFDLAIYNSVQSGVFDKEILFKTAKKQKKGVVKTAQENAISETWSLYRDSFDANESEVMEKIYEASLKNIKVISPSNLDVTVKTLKEFGRHKEATELIKKYIEGRGDEKDIFDPRESLFDSGPRDSELVAAFEKARAKFVDGRDVVDVLESMVKNKGWNTEDVELINKLKTEDFYKIFKSTRGYKLHAIIKAALQLRDKNSDGVSISERAISALTKIGKENPLNAKRVESQGIKID